MQELQVGIIQNSVLATVVTAETARTTVIAHSKHIFLQQSFYHASLPANTQHIPTGRPRLCLAFVLQNKELWWRFMN